MIQSRPGSDRVIVVGDDSAATIVAQSLPADVVFVTTNQWLAERVGDTVSETVVVDNLATYAPDSHADSILIATQTDSMNLLLAQRLGGSAVTISRLNDPANEPAFDGIDTELVCAASHVGELLVDQYATTVATQ